MSITLQLAINDGHRAGSALDQRTTRHSGYAISQRELIETTYCWTKQHRRGDDRWFVGSIA